MAEQYEEAFLEPEIRPEYIRKIRRIQKQKAIPIDDFAKHFGLK